MRNTFPLSGPCPGARTMPCSARTLATSSLPSMPSGARTAVTAQAFPGSSPNRSSPRARIPSFTAAASSLWRASTRSGPSSKYSLSASRSPWSSEMAGLHVVGPGRAPPFVVHGPDLETVRARDLGEPLAEVPRHDDHDAVPRREQVGHRRLQAARTGRREHEHVVLRPQQPLEPLGDLTQ